MREQSDHDLIARFRGGDSQAFEALVLRHQRRVFNICYKMLGDVEDAKDVCQEVLVSLLSKLAGFREESSFTTWLYRMTTNRCLDRLRAKKIEPIENELLDEGEFVWRREPPGPEAIAIAGCTRGEITRAFQALPADFRSAVLLRDIEGLGHKEIAEITGTNEGTVKSRIARGRRLLAQILSESRERIEI